MNDIDGTKPVGSGRTRRVTCRVAHVELTALDRMAQPAPGEEFQTRDLRMAPYFWGESKCFGQGSLGLEVLAGIQVKVIQGLGRVLVEGMLSLEQVFSKLDEDGYTRQVLRLKNDLGGSSVWVGRGVSVDSVLDDEGFVGEGDGCAAGR